MAGPKGKTGLGRSLIRSRFSQAGSGNRSPHVNPDGSLRHTSESDASTTNWVNMQSITQENDLEAFLSTAQLAGTEFTAEKLNVMVLDTQSFKPVLPTAEEEQKTLMLHEEHKDRLTVPRRPKWTKSTTPDELKLLERNSFLEWRRGLVFLEETEGLIMTPYERNIEVWRQLWRVVERSDLVVQIVDGRNPLLFQCKDLEKYVKEVSPVKKNLLLINKADLLTAKQREAWADYFDEQGISYKFFSAAMAKKKIVLEQEAEKLEREMAELKLEENQEPKNVNDDLVSVSELEDDDEEAEMYAIRQLQEGIRRPRRMQVMHDEEEEEEVDDLDECQDDLSPRIRIIGAEDLYDLFVEECPYTTREDNPDAKVNIGFVGYPNVGKSSTLNALVGAKKVAVGSTPGKTKHFQTIHMSDKLVLCDCPGLVFPSFATTKAEMVCNGILPIDQLREYVEPASLVAQRIPKYYLEAVYGITIKTRGIEGNLVNRAPTSEEFLSAYAVARGYTKASQGNPDEARAARYILKDYVNGKLLFIHPPPSFDALDFNREIYEDERLLRRQIKKLRVADLQAKAAATLTETSVSQRNINPSNSKAIDNTFFQKSHVEARTVGKFAHRDFSRVKLFPHQNVADDSVMPSKSGASVMSSVGGPLPTKKSHKKGKKNVKSRTQWTKDDL
ncbi:hypothetical protein QVD99_006581 [Batrachochytrium dendrobatidis]|nr:hypothetical protein O5D80_005434 [Batrachochytrium dendrobatidis]KAK5666508.1 hypothetical protein QVD99_006581 [Batrachochytrium dendrobatidis]